MKLSMDNNKQNVNLHVLLVLYYNPHMLQYIQILILCIHALNCGSETFVGHI